MALTAVLGLGLLGITAGVNAGGAGVSSSVDTHVGFVENRGQIDNEVRFYTTMESGTVSVTANGDIVYSLRMEPPRGGPAPPVLREEFVDGTVTAVKGVGKTKTRVNRFIGNDRTLWQRGLVTYRSVELAELYDGITLSLKSCGDNVEKIFSIHPGANPRNIRVRVTGANTLAVNDVGELEARTSYGPVVFTKPLAYQEGAGGTQYIDISYATDGTAYSFAVGTYDSQRTLIIDPMLASTFLGGTAHDGARIGASIAVDGSDNVYIVATTKSSDFPTTANAYSQEHANAALADICISKFNSGLTTLLASTFLGGSSDEFAEHRPNIVLDQDGNVYVVGETSSTDFPVTDGAYDGTYASGGDVFVAKLSGDLSTLLASTLLGASGRDTAGSIALDHSGDVYVAGWTRSADFPTTPGAYQTTHNGSGMIGGDIYVAKFDSDLTTLSGATLLGGGDSEYNGVVLSGPDDRICVAGSTASYNFPITQGAFDDSHNGPPGQMDAFVACLSSDLTVLEASTFLGGGGVEFGAGMTLDQTGKVYVTGLTSSPDFPITAGAFDETYTGIGGNSIGNDIFVAKFDAGLTTVLSATYLGGRGWDHAWRVAVDALGNVFLAGITTSYDFPTTPGAFSRTHQGGNFYPGQARGGEGYVARLNGNLSALAISTFIGSPGSDYLSSIAFDTEGNIYVGGGTNSSTYPTTPGAYDSSYNGGSENPWGGDLFVSKLDPLLSADCNGNGLADACDVDCEEAGGDCQVDGCGQSADCNQSGLPDECKPDCDGDGVPDACELPPYGESQDCNLNGLPDECEPDCNTNGVPD
ncbi:MAG: DUF7948 domain-containing protein, partial [Planctomycetota bacterium]